MVGEEESRAKIRSGGAGPEQSHQVILAQRFRPFSTLRRRPRRSPAETARPESTPVGKGTGCEPRRWPGRNRQADPGCTSHDVVARCRRIFEQRKVGPRRHTRPDATGVLLVGLGQATRLVRFLSGLPKRYSGEVVLPGVATQSTLDGAGEVTGTAWDMYEAVTLEAAQAAAAHTTRRVPAGRRRWSRPWRWGGGGCTGWPRPAEQRWSSHPGPSRCGASTCRRRDRRNPGLSSP